MRGKSVVGVEFMRNNTKQRVRATEEVILSAGVVGSPHILLLSGIGPRKQLERLKVGLGRNVVVWQYYGQGAGGITSINLINVVFDHLCYATAMPIQRNVQ